MTSSTIARSLLTAVFAALLTVTSVIVPAAKAEAWSNGACATAKGVTVVVDYAGLGGGTVVRCAPGSQSSGVTALRNAGFSVTNLAKDSGFGFFVCRIDNQPNPDQESCVTAPPRANYWSYWTASRGGKWVFSNAGASSRKPPLGSVEGWVFGEGGMNPPSTRVPQKMAPLVPRVTRLSLSRKGALSLRFRQPSSANSAQPKAYKYRVRLKTNRGWKNWSRWRTLQSNKRQFVLESRARQKAKARKLRAIKVRFYAIGTSSGASMTSNSTVTVRSSRKSIKANSFKLK